MVNRDGYIINPAWLPDPPARIHFVGIGGAGQSALARLALGAGYQVTGSDIASSPVVEALRSIGIDVRIGHDAENTGDAQLVVITAAARSDNPEIVAANEHGIPVIKRAAMLGLLCSRSRTLAVAGTHGKSTTSGMASYALTEVGLSPSFAVGAEIPQLGGNARSGTGEHFIVEADEYDYSFLWLQPEVAIISAIEHDHPDLFPTFADILAAFASFVRRIRPGGTLVISAENAGCRMLVDQIDPDQELSVVTFGEGDQPSDWTLRPGGKVFGPGDQTFELRLELPGRHNRRNALAVLAAAEPMGIQPATLIDSLNRFRGVGRRSEVRRADPDRVVIEDYAHHPTEIEAMIQATRERYPSRRLMILFQPHTYSRTRALLTEFGHALSMADEVVIADIYPARETDDLGVSAGTLAEKVLGSVSTGGTVEESARRVLDWTRPGDVILVLGAGDIYRATPIIAEGK